jgi:ribonuclease HI
LSANEPPGTITSPCKRIAAERHQRGIANLRNPRTLLVYTDGLLLPGGQGGWGAVALRPNGRVAWELWGSVRGGTINDAEAHALWGAVRRLAEEEGPVFFYTDNVSLVAATRGRPPLSSANKLKSI